VNNSAELEKNSPFLREITSINALLVMRKSFKTESKVPTINVGWIGAVAEYCT